MMKKKLATPTKAYQDTAGNLHSTSKRAVMGSARDKLGELVRRIERSGRAIPEECFLSAASWFKENPELVKLLTHYDPESKELKDKPSDYADYLKTRIKRGAVWESYDQWKTRIVTTKATTAFVSSVNEMQSLAEVDKLIADGTLPVKAVANENQRPERSVLGNVTKSDSKYPA